MESKELPVGVNVMALCFPSINLCALSSFCCCIIVASSSHLMITCYFYSRLCTSSSSSCCRAKESWSSLEIYALSSGGLEMAIVPIITEEIWSTICSSLICCNLFSLVSFEKLFSLCCNNAARIASLLVEYQNHFLWMAHWPHRWCKM